MKYPEIYVWIWKLKTIMKNLQILKCQFASRLTSNYLCLNNESDVVTAWKYNFRAFDLWLMYCKLVDS
jgi:hypothetical protein